MPIFVVVVRRRKGREEVGRFGNANIREETELNDAEGRHLYRWQRGGKLEKASRSQARLT